MKPVIVCSVMLMAQRTLAEEDLLELPLDELLQISIVGQGQLRQLQILSEDDLALLPAGTNPMKALEKLPGVLFESADPYGNYEWASRFSVRGFAFHQLGYTLDGLPLGDMSYAMHNGLNIGRAVILEDLRRVELAQGSGTVATASNSNLGGSVQFFSSDPYAQNGLRFSHTQGSSDSARDYLRVDSGNRNGLSAYVSLLQSTADKWKGEGEQEQQQMNAKLLYQQAGWRAQLFYDWSTRNETDYADLSLDSRRRLGWGWDNYAGDWQRAVDAAHGIFSGNVNSKDDAYYAGRGLRDDRFGSLSVKCAFSDNLNAALLYYRQNSRGEGHWFTPYVASSDSAPISLRATTYGIDRDGEMLSVNFSRWNQDWEWGLWKEHDEPTLHRDFYAVEGPVHDDYYFQQPFSTQFSQQFQMRTRQWYARDTLHFLHDDLRLSAGFKAMKVTTVSQALAGSRAGGELSVDDGFLPQLSAIYLLAPGWEVFASYARNVAAFRAGTSGPFSSSQSAYDVSHEYLQPERSESLEGGLRYKGGQLAASATLYAVDFSDRLLAIGCCGITGSTTAYANVGKVRTRGVELTVQWLSGQHWRWLNTLSYNDSRYANNYFDHEVEVDIDGNHVVDMPTTMFSSELGFRFDRLTLRAATKYSSERYATFMNDSKVPGFWVADAGAAYEWTEFGALYPLRLQLNISNIFDEHYYSTVGSNGFAVSDPEGKRYTLQTGVPRQVWLGLELGF